MISWRNIYSCSTQVVYYVNGCLVSQSVSQSVSIMQNSGPGNYWNDIRDQDIGELVEILCGKAVTGLSTAALQVIDC